MSDLILHHYPMSPFAEKARLMLGQKGLAWSSVHVPSIMPKPDVLALTGGYRRTPLLQIGADIICDTALIADELEHRRASPSLFPSSAKGLARVVAQWAETQLFWAAMAYSISARGAVDLFGQQPPDAAKAFAADRGRMSTGMTRLRAPDAASAYRSYLRRIEAMLDGQNFLLGEEPCIADFAVYHPLWFTRTQVPSMAGILAPLAPVLAWMDRMAALGHGEATAMTSQAAIEVAAAAVPRELGADLFQDDHGLALGTRVTVAAESFGPEATEGTLVAATRTRYVLRREDERAGVVHVHFPRVGYVLRACEPS